MLLPLLMMWRWLTRQFQQHHRAELARAAGQAQAVLAENPRQSTQQSELLRVRGEKLSLVAQPYNFAQDVEGLADTTQWTCFSASLRMATAIRRL